MQRLIKYNFVSEKYGKLENCSDWHSIINTISSRIIHKDPTWSIRGDTDINSPLYDLIQTSLGININERIIMKAVDDMDISDYKDRLMAIDCIRKGIILSRCKIRSYEDAIS